MSRIITALTFVAATRALVSTGRPTAEGVARPEATRGRRWGPPVLAFLAGLAVAAALALAALEPWNLAATRSHPGLVYTAIAVVRDAAIARQARAVTIPDDYAPALTAEGGGSSRSTAPTAMAPPASPHGAWRWA